MKIIINADDLGLCVGQNEGIKEAHTNGVVTSATLLVNGMGFDHALQMIRALPTLDVGVHLTLTLGTPVLPKDQVQSLVAETGVFKRHDLTKPLGLDEREVYAEWRAQIEKALQHHITITHLDSHHHIHLHPELFSVGCRLAREYQLPLRYVKDLFGSLEEASCKDVTLIHCDPRFYLDNITPAFFKNYTPPYPQDIWEIMCHPAHVDDWLRKNSAYHVERETELQTLTNPVVLNYLNDQGIRLAQHREVN
jgi:predicted glycoside hydrolase/deacetylase ChbG (UPF0249 family)